jgi:hypothetical protein
LPRTRLDFLPPISLEGEDESGEASVITSVLSIGGGGPIGSVDIGSVDTGDVDIGSVDIGSVDIGSVDIGSVDIGSVDIGSVNIGSVNIGSVNIGSVDIGEASVITSVLSIGGGGPIGSTKSSPIDIEELSVGFVYTGFPLYIKSSTN